jgi:hypothetical protein
VGLFVTARASPYRVAETALMTRERALEGDLARAREVLDTFSNEEARIQRKVPFGASEREELSAITATVEQLIGTVDRLSHELASVRDGMVARGERKKIDAMRTDGLGDRPGIILVLASILIGALFAGFTHLHRVDTATDAPEGTSLGWGGPLEPGQTWLYVEGPSGGAFEVDGRPFHGPNRLAVSALHPHEVRFAGGGRVLVRWIPCTTAVVLQAVDGGEPSVERFYNSATCF